jgi:short-subunit dehydrogenase
MKNSAISAGLLITALGVTTYACARERQATRLRLTRLREGQVAIITGGSRGLGLALAHRLGRAGLKLILAARSKVELEQARRELLEAGSVACTQDIITISCDVTNQEQAAELIAASLSAFGTFDVLINNAGVIEVGPMESQPIQAYERAMATNFFGALYMTYAALPTLLAKQSGAIVNISSIGGKFAVPHMLPYVASKFALTGFSEGLHSELRHKGISVTTVCPGLMRTGGETHAHFCGDIDKEKEWFQTCATTPFLAASATYAADRIFEAVNSGSAELTITPQAWLPGMTQVISSLVNEYVLPAQPKGDAWDQLP